MQDQATNTGLLTRLKAMEEKLRDVDLSDVPALLRGQTRRRVKAIQQYLSPAKPKEQTARYFADQLKITEGRFRSMVATWRRYRKASALAGASYPKSKARELEPELASIVDSLREQTIPGARFSDIMRSLRKRCAELSLKAPPRAAVARHIAQYSARDLETPRRHQIPGGTIPPAAHEGPPLLLIDHLDLDIDVFNADGALSSAAVDLAILLPEQVVVCHYISTDHASPQSVAQVLLKALGYETHGAPLRNLAYSLPDGKDWSALEAAVMNAGISYREVERAPFADLQQHLLKLCHLAFGPEAAEELAQAPPVTVAEAASRISAAINRHNQQLLPSKHDTPSFAVTIRPRSALLREQLAEIAKQRIGPIRTRSGAKPRRLG